MTVFTSQRVDVISTQPDCEKLSSVQDALVTAWFFSF